MSKFNKKQEVTVPNKGLVPWLGGKHYLAKQIIERIEAVPHDVYAEPFIGMGNVFLRRRLTAKREVINDKSGEVVNLYRCIARHPHAVIRALGQIPSSRQEFERFRRTDASHFTDIERAARFAFLQLNAFSGKIGGSYSVRLNHQPGHAGTVAARWHRISKRMRRVTIESLDWSDFICRYDSSGTLFYLDPPYYGVEDYYGKNLFPRADYEKMAAQLGAIKGQFMLSLNNRPEVRGIFAAFKIDEVSITYRTNGASKVTELIISNQPKTRRRRAA